MLSKILSCFAVMLLSDELQVLSYLRLSVLAFMQQGKESKQKRTGGLETVDEPNLKMANFSLCCLLTQKLSCLLVSQSKYRQLLI